MFVPSSFSTNIFLNHFKHIIAVRVFTEQPQDLLDGLAEHLTAIQHLELRHSHPPTDLSFLFELKQLTRLKLRFQTSSKWISRLFDELPYLINLEIDGAAIRVQSDGQFETQQTKTKKIWQNLDSAIRCICPEEPALKKTQPACRQTQPTTKSSGKRTIESEQSAIKRGKVSAIRPSPRSPSPPPRPKSIEPPPEPIKRVEPVKQPELVHISALHDIDRVIKEATEKPNETRKKSIKQRVSA